MEFCDVDVGFNKLCYMVVMKFPYNLLNDFVSSDLFVVFAAMIDTLL